MTNLNVASQGGISLSTGNNPTPDYPAGIVAGDKLVLFVAFKYSSGTGITTPSGWSQEGVDIAGIGANGADSGTFRHYAFTRDADGSETGSLSITLTGTIDVYVAQMFRVTKATGTWQSVLGRDGREDTAATPWDQNFSGAFTSGLAGDLILTWVTCNGDRCVPNAAMTLGFDSGANTANAMTNLTNGSTSTGDDLSWGANWLVLTGPVSVTGFGQTFSGTTTANTPTGSVIGVRLRAA